MPEGQFQGDRAKYVYVSDDGRSYRLNLDVTLATLAGTGLVADTETSGATNKPTNFKPRVVFWQGTLNQLLRRKELICGTNDAPLFASPTSQLLTVDGVVGVITGRRGETLTY